MSKKRIGILTSGTVSPGLNAAIRASARTIFKLGHEVIAIESGFDGFFDRDMISLPHLSHFQGLLYKGGSILGLPDKGDPFNFPVIRQNEIKYINRSDVVLQAIDDFKMNALIVICGYHDFDVCRKFSDAGVKIIFVPNYINNDFLPSAESIGFKSAVQTASHYLDRLHSTAESHHRVFVVEVLGNRSGWIALESGISGGADVILIPEIPFNINAIANTLKARTEKGAPFSLIVLSSGAKPDGEIRTDDKLNMSEYILKKLSDLIDLESRGLSLSLIQRGGSPTAYDRILASNFGALAAEIACNSSSNSHALFYREEVKSALLSDTSNDIKLISSNHRQLQVAEYLNISMGVE
ncbi:MAG: ATP-dependent 6-phosphofructokinase [Acidobacteria bacterium]|nr:ATP-dependent 6-phosphofructokinase [Acidobacteriota bacterium]